MPCSATAGSPGSDPGYPGRRRGARNMIVSSLAWSPALGNGRCDRGGSGHGRWERPSQTAAGRGVRGRRGGDDQRARPCAPGACGHPLRTGRDRSAGAGRCGRRLATDRGRAAAPAARFSRPWLRRTACGAARRGGGAARGRCGGGRAAARADLPSCAGAARRSGCCASWSRPSPASASGSRPCGGSMRTGGASTWYAWVTAARIRRTSWSTAVAGAALSRRGCLPKRSSTSRPTRRTGHAVTGCGRDASSPRSTAG